MVVILCLCIECISLANHSSNVMFHYYLASMFRWVLHKVYLIGVITVDLLKLLISPYVTLPIACSVEKLACEDRSLTGILLDKRVLSSIDIASMKKQLA